jgi:hypothetical protein
MTGLGVVGAQGGMGREEDLKFEISKEESGRRWTKWTWWTDRDKKSEARSQKGWNVRVIRLTGWQPILL